MKEYIDVLKKWKDFDSVGGGSVAALGGGLGQLEHLGALGVISKSEGARSEERRVGKECRSRWSPYH